MKNLKAVIAEQYDFIMQTTLTWHLLHLYNHDPEIFKKLISPQFLKLYNFKDVYDDPEALWEYCEFISELICHRNPLHGNLYPVVKNVDKPNEMVCLTKSKKKYNEPSDFLEYFTYWTFK
jgi:hypothetical protein